jgi:hypothetical protein
MNSPDSKKLAIKIANKIGVHKAAEECDVPVKSLKRWLKVGHERMKGGGRKTKDPQMEAALYKWYEQMRTK